MSIQENQAMKSVEIALENALARLQELEGLDRLAFANEYKEWLVDKKMKEQVWFSIALDNERGRND
tara:strand:+ start:199 stop:396 length:198 start_codon:yes stop_codon:yes gene_type:complete